MESKNKSEEMKLYRIKPIKWKEVNNSHSDSLFFRESSIVLGYHSYSIFKYKYQGKWTPFFLEIRLDNNTFWPKNNLKTDQPKESFQTLEEAESAANEHYTKFVERFLEIYENQ